MRRLAYLIAATVAAAPGSARDLELMVGLRSTMASALRDHGLNCPDVKQFVELGAAGDAVLLEVRCGPLGAARAFERSARVRAYVDGDYSLDTSSLR